MLYILTKTKRCACSTRKYSKRGLVPLHIPARLGFGDTVADWIHRLLRLTPCAACQRRRRLLNILFPYVARTSLEYRAWNAYLSSGLPHLPVIWDSETGLCSPP